MVLGTSPWPPGTGDGLSGNSWAGIVKGTPATLPAREVGMGGEGEERVK